MTVGGRNHFVLGVTVLVAVGALTFSACGGDGDSVSQEQADEQAQEAVAQALEDEKQKQKLAEIQAELKRLQQQQKEQRQDESPSSGGTTPAPPPSASGIPTSAGSCGAGVYVNSVTSCPFAQNVLEGYLASGSGTFEVFSPTTAQTYTMSCGGTSVVTCTGGNDAAVYIDL